MFDFQQGSIKGTTGSVLPRWKSVSVPCLNELTLSLFIRLNSTVLVLKDRGSDVWSMHIGSHDKIVNGKDPFIFDVFALLIR